MKQNCINCKYLFNDDCSPFFSCMKKNLRHQLNSTQFYSLYASAEEFAYIWNPFIKPISKPCAEFTARIKDTFDHFDGILQKPFHITNDQSFEYSDQQIVQLRAEHSRSIDPLDDSLITADIMIPISLNPLTKYGLNNYQTEVRITDYYGCEVITMTAFPGTWSLDKDSQTIILPVSPHNSDYIEVTLMVPDRLKYIMDVMTSCPRVKGYKWWELNNNKHNWRYSGYSAAVQFLSCFEALVDGTDTNERCAKMIETLLENHEDDAPTYYKTGQLRAVRDHLWSNYPGHPSVLERLAEYFEAVLDKQEWRSIHKDYYDLRDKVYYGETHQQWLKENYCS